MKDRTIKIIEFIKKHDNIFVIMLIFLSILGITMNMKIHNSDELWDFQNIYKMYNGYEIYKDSNVITTPLFFYVGEFLFKILGANFLTFRLYNIFILVSLFFIIYLLMKKINISKKMAIITILILIMLNKFYIVRIQANYNTMALTIGILGVYLYLKKYNSIIQAIIIFLIFITKQNIGVFYAIGLFFCELFEKDDIKQSIKNILIEIFVFLICLIFSIIYLYCNNNLYNFINYAFLGIKEFATMNISVQIKNVILIIFFIGINTLMIFTFIKNKKVDLIQKKQLITIYCFSIPFILITIPILNDAHFLFGIYLSIILFVALINILIKEIDININKKAINLVLIMLIIFECGYSIYNYFSWNKVINSENYKFEKEHPFYGGICEDSLINNIDNITEYIQNNSKDVIVLSSKAALYMIPIKKSNGMLDLPFKGNLGKEGEEGVIDILKNKKNTQILIEKEENNIFWQESKKVRQYIIENMKKIGEIEEFEIYE